MLRLLVLQQSFLYGTSTETLPLIVLLLLLQLLLPTHVRHAQYSASHQTAC